MTYREHVHALSTAMSTLLRDGGQVAAADLDQALASQTALVRLLHTVHADVTGIVHPSTRPDLRGLEEAPVALLSRMLRDHPATADLPISAAAAVSAASPAGELWRQIGRHATVAEHDWRTALPASRPTGDARWTETADIAALSEGLAVLSGDLADSLASAGRLTDADRFRRASTSGLASTAGAVRRLAQAGPTPAPADVTATASRRVIVVRDAEHLPAALHRLGHLLRSATDIAPAHVQLVARALATAALAGAQGLTAGVESTQAAGTLRRHADRLADVTASPRRVAALVPGDPAPLAQAQQIHQGIATARRNGWQPTPEQAVAIGRGVAEATDALDTVVGRQIAEKRWLTPKDGAQPGLPEWQPIAWPAPEPELVAAVHAAGQQARAIRSVLPDQPTATRWPAPRQSLAAALALRTAPVRPSAPSRPIAGKAARR